MVDRRPYKAQLDQAQGQVNLYEAQLKLARTTLARDRAVNALAPGSISPQQIDSGAGRSRRGQGQGRCLRKSMEISRLNHEFTRILSPIDGQISFYRKTIGNLVNQNETRLTTVVSVDPMYVYFEMDEPTVLRYRRAVNEGKLQVPKDRANVPVFMGLQGEDGFPRQGAINFVDNQVNPTTGSIQVRGVFANPEVRGGHRQLSPGRFAKIRLPIGVPHRALLVIDRAIASDREGRKYVYVLDADNKVQTRRITTGALQEDGLRVIEEGSEARRLGCQRRNSSGAGALADHTGPGGDAHAKPNRPWLLRHRPYPRCQNCRDRKKPKTERVAGHALSLLHRSTDLCDGSVRRHHVNWRNCALLAADRAVSPNHTAWRGGDHQLPRGERPVVADTVAAVIEQQVNGVEGMLYMSSQMGNDGSYTLTVTFDIGTDVNTALVMVQNRVALAMPQLPTRGPEPRDYDPQENSRHSDDRQLLLAGWSL